jgi:hypothetical protein
MADERRAAVDEREQALSVRVALDEVELVYSYAAYVQGGRDERLTRRARRVVLQV